jgi:hypothetical protein
VAHEEEGEVASQGIVVQRTTKVVEMWLRYVEILRGEEEMVHICEPEAGKSLSDDEQKRSEKGLRNCQVRSEELSGFQRAMR